MKTHLLFLPLLLVACGEDNAGPTGAGAVDLQISTQGGDVDTDGYIVLIDGVVAQSVPPDGIVSITDLRAVEHVFELQGVADNCSVVGGRVRHITVEKDALLLVGFGVLCEATGIRVITAFSGLDQDPVLHILLNNTLRPEVVETGSNQEVTRLAPGPYEVRLGDLSPNCQVEPASVQVTVTLRQVTETRFTGHCLATSGIILVTVGGHGEDMDQNGYSVAVPGVSGVTALSGETLVLPSVPPGVHPLRLAGVAHNCAVTGLNPRDVTVAAGTEKRDTVVVVFEVQCTRVWEFAFSRGGQVSLATHNADVVEPTLFGTSLAWSPDGRRLAFSCGLLCLIDLQGAGVATRTVSDVVVDKVAWRPDGQRVLVSLQSCTYYYCAFAGLMLLSLDDDSRVTVPLPADVVWVSGITWSPDGTTIAFGCSFIQGAPPRRSARCSQMDPVSGCSRLARGGKRPGLEPRRVANRVRLVALRPDGNPSHEP